MYYRRIKKTLKPPASDAHSCGRLSTGGALKNQKDTETDGRGRLIENRAGVERLRRIKKTLKQEALQFVWHSMPCVFFLKNQKDTETFTSLPGLQLLLLLLLLMKNQKDTETRSSQGEESWCRDSPKFWRIKKTLKQTVYQIPYPLLYLLLDLRRIKKTLKPYLFFVSFFLLKQYLCKRRIKKTLKQLRRRRL